MSMVAIFLVLMTVVATPLAAQFGGLKKKVRAAAGVTPPTAPTAQPAADAGGGTLVLDDEVVGRLIKGYQAARAERDAAAKADTPYGRRFREEAAYKIAKPKCDAATATFSQRMVADTAMMAKSGRYMEKMSAAQQKQDTAAARAWGDSLLMLQDPACVVKLSPQPQDYWDNQRRVDSLAEAAQLKAADMDRRELGASVDRAIAILDDAPPPDVSPSEKDAVQKRKAELNRWMGREPPPAPAATAAPAPVAPTPQPTGPTVSPEQQASSQCMAKNAKQREADIERLGEEVRKAAERGDNMAAMAYADSIRVIQSAGCP